MVELLLLDPPELLVAVVVVERREGEVRRPLAAARTARWSSSTSSSSDEESDEESRLDRVRLCLCRTTLEDSSRHAIVAVGREEEEGVFGFSLLVILPTLLLGACLCDRFVLSLCLSPEDREGAIFVS